MRTLGVGLLFCLASSVSTAGLFGPSLRKFVILGNQTIECAVKSDGAVSVENNEVKIEVTGTIVHFEDGGDSTLTPTYGFTLKKPLTLLRVTVEDVTGPAATLLVTDEHPSLNKNYWKGNAATRVINERNIPWLYARGDTWRVFRFTLSTTEKGDIVMLQPSLNSEASKVQFVATAARARNAPPAALMDRFSKSASEVLQGNTRFMLLPVLAYPPPEKSSELFAGLKVAGQQKLSMAIATEKAYWAEVMIDGALDYAAKGQFSGQLLVVVAPDAEAARFAKLAGSSGLTIKVGPLIK